MRKCVIILLLTAISTIFSGYSYGQTAPDKFENPIISGYHPDPSICRVGDDYYLVNSTFVWFPGIPVYHSKDLVNWKLIGHGIDRPEQIDLSGLPDKLGIFAVTIRYHEGTFYLITTAVGCGGNFYITAKDPAGPWSDPIWLKDAPGIDPSMMWDDDGRCYYTGHKSMDREEWPTQMGIWNQELDLEKGELVGPRKLFTHGHANNASYTEGPHLYKIDGKYLLMVSEGGTGLFHALSVHHSDSIWGPYVADMINPVITHRHFGENYPVQAIGHGDLVETQNGEWWGVTLGKRVIDGETTLGRETFLSKVEFENGTPIFNPGEGRVLTEQKRPNLPWTPVDKDPERDQFNSYKLNANWCFIRTPKSRCYELDGEKLELKLSPEVVDSLVNSSMIIKRIESHKFEASTMMTFKSKKDNEQSGIIVYRTNENHYQLVKSNKELQLIKSFKGEKEVLATIPYTKDHVCLKVEGDDLDIKFSYGESEDNMLPIGDVESLIVIADGNGNQFNGPGVGIYGTSNGTKTNKKAYYEWFEYKNL